jgi:hypothetical protein
LSGWAGTGKSTLARTVAREYYNRGRLGASFFFSRGKEDVSHAGEFFTSIAIQLAGHSPALGDLIRKAISSNPHVASQVRRDQWKLLILEPLSKLEAGSLQQPLVLVIDALDECDGDNDIRGILQLFSKVKTLGTVGLRIFVTSRPETPIRLGFHNMPGILHQDLILHEIPQGTVDNDILVFLEYKFGIIRDESYGLPPHWPGQKYIDKLVLSAHGLFIYAATICRFIEESIQDFPADNLLRLILPDEGLTSALPGDIRNINTFESPTKELDMMYTQVLEHSFKNVRHPKNKEQLAAIFRQVVGTIVILFDPLSLTAISRLLNMDDEIIKKRLERLRSVLEVPNRQEHAIRLLHPSFRDFLLDDKRCCSQQFWVEEKKAHGFLAEYCVRLMSGQLRKDISRLHTPGVLAKDVQGDTIKHCLPAELQYACTYWVRHLQRCETSLFDNGPVHVFLCEHLLHWIEALSLIGKTSEGVHAIASLESIVKVSLV